MLLLVGFFLKNIYHLKYRNFIKKKVKVNFNLSFLLIRRTIYENIISWRIRRNASWIGILCIQQVSTGNVEKNNIVPCNDDIGSTTEVVWKQGLANTHLRYSDLEISRTGNSGGLDLELKLASLIQPSSGSNIRSISVTWIFFKRIYITRNNMG